MISYSLLSIKTSEKEADDHAEFISSLEEGSYVVHLFHGIAQYKGLTSMVINEVERDYMILEYAGKDRIFVPVEMSDRVDLYIGSPSPKLHKLSDTTWTQTFRKNKEETMALAKELLELYAKT